MELRAKINNIIFHNTPHSVNEDDITEKIMYEIGSCEECEHVIFDPDDGCFLCTKENGAGKTVKEESFCSDFERRENEHG